MGISEEKMKIVIDNYFKTECNIDTSIREAFEKGFRIGVKKGSSAQPEFATDAVNRQAAIDVVEGSAELIRRVLDNMDVVIGERGKFAYGLGLLESCIEELSGLPLAQPEIIRCKDCKYWHQEIHNGIEYFNFSSCVLNHNGDGHNFYCADVKRRTDE